MYEPQRQCKRGLIGVTMPSNLKDDEHVLCLLFLSIVYSLWSVCCQVLAGGVKRGARE